MAWAGAGMRRLLFYSFLTALLSAGSYLWSDTAESIGVGPSDLLVEAVRIAFLIGGTLVGALAVLSFLDAFLWRGLLVRRSGKPTPRLIIDLTSVLVWLFAAGFLFARMSDQVFTGLIATSSVAIAVAGFALRGLIADLFSGLAVSLERPYTIGDWIDLGSLGQGEVVEMTWRTTRLLESNKNILIIPNSRISELVFRNASRPDPTFRETLSITLDLTVSAARVERVLLSAVRQVPEIAALDGPAYVSVESITERGVVWRLVFTVPRAAQAREMRDRVWRNVLRNLFYAGISAPAVRQRVVETDEGLGPSNILAANLAFLHRVELFRSLTDQEVETLYAGADVRIAEKGEVVVHQGEGGESLFVLCDGLLDVRIARPDGKIASVAQLKAGQFFGEMSLLTGAPRSATVTALMDSKIFEITRDALRPIMQERHELADIMSEVLARRQIINLQAAREESAPLGHADEKVTLTAQFLFKIKGLFSLKH